MKIAIRMDDITPDMDWERFGQMKALLDEYKVKPLIGVVPDNKDENLDRKSKEAPADFWEYIRMLIKDGWAVALHGYRHLYTEKKGGIFPLNNFSEFAGISYEKQCEMIAEGRRIFKKQGIVTDMFMAPAHSYDNNTLKALKENGFLKMTDGFGSRPYIRKGITFYPIAFRLSSSLKKKEGITTMVIHTNTMKDSDLERYRRILESKEVISFGEYLNEAAVTRKAAGNIGEYILAAGKRMLIRFL